MASEFQGLINQFLPQDSCSITKTSSISV